MSFIAVITLLIVAIVDRAAAESPEEIKLAHDFLIKFGYKKQARFGDLSTSGLSTFRDALKDMQRFAGLNETGVIDRKTLELLTTPRCGLPDVNPTGSNRTKRYALYGRKWTINALTYIINNYPTQLLSASAVPPILAAAFKLWTDVTCLSISPTTSTAANIQIGFYSYDHGDGSPFDGPLNVLAHGFYPPTGWLHFDNSETWTDGVSTGINLLQVAVHEMGHVLGLDHSTVQTAIMYPYYRGYVANAQLDPDDIAGIRALYGTCTPATKTTTKLTSTSTTTKPTSTTTKPTSTSTTTKPTSTTTKPTTTKAPTTTCRLVCG